MPTYTFKTRQSAPMLRQIVLTAIGMMTGKARSTPAVEGIKLRIAAAFFAKVKAAFVVKSRGGTDEAGCSWKPLSARYLAYGRRGIIKSVKVKTTHPKPFNVTKFIGTAEYKRIYRSELARLSAGHPPASAKMIAKTNSVRIGQQNALETKIAVARGLSPGADYEILRDTGVLLNSLSPGVVSGDSYSAKPDQIVRTPAGELIVGTNVSYAAVHHFGSAARHIPARPFWPEGNRIPSAWLADFAAAGRRGLEVLMLDLLRRAG